MRLGIGRKQYVCQALEPGDIMTFRACDWVFSFGLDEALESRRIPNDALHIFFVSTLECMGIFQGKPVDGFENHHHHHHHHAMSNHPLFDFFGCTLPLAFADHNSRPQTQDFN